MNTPVILVVDDSALSRALIRKKLEAKGYRVLEAPDGAQGAVAALKERPQLVISDLDMPIMDGFQLARLIKNDPATRGIRVIILTSHTQASSRFWGLLAGADAYITKEDLDLKLLPVVENFLALSPPEIDAGATPPQDILDVLARVARQLDNGLMEATLGNHILRIGHGDKKLAVVSAQLLELFSRLTRAHLLGLAIVEEKKLSIFLHRPAVSRIVLDLQKLSRFVLDRLGKTAEDIAEVSIDGDTEGTGATIAIEEGKYVSFNPSQGRALLVVWPCEPDLFEKETRTILEKAAPQVSLVLENAVLSERLWKLSTLDGLTGLLNHRSIRQRLFEEFDRAQRYQIPLTVGIADLDHFKRVNDTWGHLVGDEVLRGMARRLLKGLRSSDILGRYGGEEFLIILPHSQLSDARLVCNRICRNFIEDALEINGVVEKLNITASFGLASLTEISGPDAAETLIGLADSRLYEAKESGRARVKPD